MAVMGGAAEGTAFRIRGGEADAIAGRRARGEVESGARGLLLSPPDRSLWPGLRLCLLPQKYELNFDIPNLTLEESHHRQIMCVDTCSSVILGIK